MLYQGLYGANLHNFLEFHAGCMKKVKGIIKLRDKTRECPPARIPPRVKIKKTCRRNLRRKPRGKIHIGGSSAESQRLKNVLAEVPPRVKVKKCVGGSSAGGKTLRNVLAEAPKGRRTNVNNFCIIPSPLQGSHRSHYDRRGLRSSLAPRHVLRPLRGSRPKYSYLEPH